MDKNAIAFIEAFLARHPSINSAVRVLVAAVVTAVLLEAGLDSVASEAVSVAP
jgi:hypothetical protein